MAQSETARKFWAGLFFLALLALVAGFVFMLGLEKGFTEKKFPMTVLFREIGGLNVGAPVRVAGVTVGTVSDIRFLDEDVEGRSVAVELSLYEKYRKQLHKAEKFAIITEGVLGDKIIKISTRSSFNREDLTQPVLGQDPLDVENLVETFGQAAVALLETSKTVEAMTAEIERIAGNTRRLLQRIERRVIDGSLFRVF